MNQLSLERLQFLAELPILLNSSLKTGTVIDAALKYLRVQLKAEAATVFLTQSSGKELMFWALQGSGASGLAGKKMAADKGLVGWVIRERKPLLVNDVQNDPRFFPDIDQESAFKTESVVCVPLVARGKKLIGALQVLNKHNKEPFTADDLAFIEKFAHQAALAIFNAKLYREAQNTNRRLAALNRKKDDVISVLVHEFRTPINVVQNSAELLLSDTLAVEARETIHRTLKSGLERLVGVISRIRDVSAVTNGDLTIEKSTVVLGEIFDVLKSQFEPVVEKRRQSLEFHVTPGAELVYADQTLLLVALKNLLANAVRFTPDGGSIALAAGRTAGLIELAVTDTGIGIDPAEQDAVFDTFYEVTDATHHSSGTYEFRSCGLGLGLATTKAIVEGHGSTISVKSAPGEGSRFSFHLSAAEKVQQGS